mgnify:CR=1 FL=1
MVDFGSDCDFCDREGIHRRCDLCDRVCCEDCGAWSFRAWVCDECAKGKGCLVGVGLVSFALGCFLIYLLWGG